MVRSSFMTMLRSALIPHLNNRVETTSRSSPLPLHNKKNFHNETPTEPNIDFMDQHTTIDEDELHDASFCSSNNDFKERVYTSGGILSPLERIPLWMKLVLSLFLSFIGTIAFGAVLIVDQGISQLIHSTQKERGFSSFFLGPNGTQFLDSLASARSTTDVEMEHVKTLLKRNSAMHQGLLQPMVDPLYQYMEDLTLHRQKVDSLNITISAGIGYYTVWNDKMLDMISVISTTTPSLSVSFSQTRAILNLMIRFQEKMGIVRAQGVNALEKTSFTQSEYQDFLISIANKRYIEHDIYLLQNEAERTKFQSEYYLLPEYKTVTDIESVLLSNEGPFSINSQIWWKCTTQLIDTLKTIQDKHSATLLKDVTSQKTAASGIMSAIICSVIIVVIASIILALVFSQTIIGPWQRILSLQNDTIMKYVPKGFLRLMKTENIMDVKLGDISNKNLDIFFADIRDFTKTAEKFVAVLTNQETVGPEVTFEYLNAYLRQVTPVFQKYSGFIDSYLGDGIMALFDQRPCMSIAAAIEFQRKVTLFNARQGHKYPPLRLGIGINSGPVSCGLVGSHGRVQGTMISDAVNTASRVESLTKRYGAKILITAEALKNAPDYYKFESRYIGCVRAVGKETGIDLHQVLDVADAPDTKLIGTKPIFEQGIQFMFVAPYNIHQAMQCFKEAVALNPDDTTAQLRLFQAEEMIRDRSLMESWTGMEVITSK